MYCFFFLFGVNQKIFVLKGMVKRKCLVSSDLTNLSYLSL